MEIQFDNESAKGPRPVSRVYAPNKRRRDDGFEPEEAGGILKAPAFKEEKPKVIRQMHEVKPLTRFAIIVCAFIFAGMVLFILTGYEKISRAYSGVNTLTTEIDQAHLSINALEAAIECAVTIDQAQSAAQEYGMQYPNESQYVSAGSAIPVTAGPGTGALTEDGQTDPEDGDTAATDPENAQPDAQQPDGAAPEGDG